MLACPLPDLVTLTGKELLEEARERSLLLFDPPLRLPPDDGGAALPLHDCLREEGKGVAVMIGVAGKEADATWCGFCPEF